MKTVFLVYEGDQWLSRDSLSLRGSYTTREKAVQSVLRNHRIKPAEVRDSFGSSSDEMSCREDVNRLLRSELESQDQTQGYSSNYMIEEASLDKEEWD